MFSQRGIGYRLFSFSLTAIFCATMLASDIFSIQSAEAAQISLSKPGTILELSASYSEPVLRGLKLDLDNPFNLEFIVDTADKGNVDKQEASKLVRYFLAGLTTKNDDIWVNLSPYEKNRITSDVLANTDLGKDLLEQDYILKQLSASLTFPETETGKAYWANDLASSDLSKIWISPDVSTVYEKENTVLITEATLKVDTQADSASVDSTALLTLLPSVTREVNEGKNFANLRQIYHSLILADWFKSKLKDTFFKHYIDHGKTDGIDINDPMMKDKIWNQYYEAFKKGAYDYIKKEKDIDTGRIQKKKYFSGGYINEINTQSSSITPDTSIFIGDSSAKLSVTLMDTFEDDEDIKYNNSSSVGTVFRKAGTVVLANLMVAAPLMAETVAAGEPGWVSPVSMVIKVALAIGLGAMLLKMKFKQHPEVTKLLDYIYAVDQLNKGNENYSKEILAEKKRFFVEQGVDVFNHLYFTYSVPNSSYNNPELVKTAIADILDAIEAEYGFEVYIKGLNAAEVPTRTASLGLLAYKARKIIDSYSADDINEIHKNRIELDKIKEILDQQREGNIEEVHRMATITLADVDEHEDKTLDRINNELGKTEQEPKRKQEDKIHTDSQDEEEYRSSKDIHFGWNSEESFQDNYDRYMRDYNSSAVGADVDSITQSSSVFTDFQNFRAQMRLNNAKTVDELFYSINYLFNNERYDIVEKIFDKDKKWPREIARIIDAFDGIHDSYFFNADQKHYNFSEVVDFLFDILDTKREKANVAVYGKLLLFLKYRSFKQTYNEELARLSELTPEELKVALSNNELFDLVTLNKHMELFSKVVSNNFSHSTGYLNKNYLADEQFLANLIDNYDGIDMKSYDINKLNDIIAKFEPYAAVMSELLSNAMYLAYKLDKFSTAEDVYGDLEKSIVTDITTYIFDNGKIVLGKDNMIEELFKNNFKQASRVLYAAIENKTTLNSGSVDSMADTFNKRGVLNLDQRDLAAMILDKISDKMPETYAKSTMDKVLSARIFHDEYNLAGIYAQIFLNILNNNPDIIDENAVNLFFRQQALSLERFRKTIFRLFINKPELKSVIWKNLLELDHGNLVLASYANEKNDDNLAKYIIARNINNGLTERLLDYTLDEMVRIDSKYQVYKDGFKLFAERIDNELDFSEILEGKIIRRWKQKETVIETVQTDQAFHYSGHSIGEDKFEDQEVEKDVEYSETIDLRERFHNNSDIEALIDYLNIISQQKDELEQKVQTTYDINIKELSSSSSVIYNIFTKVGRAEWTVKHERNIWEFNQAFNYLLKSGNKDKADSIVFNRNNKFNLEIGEYISYYKQFSNTELNYNDFSLYNLYLNKVDPDYYLALNQIGINDDSTVSSFHAMVNKPDATELKKYLDAGFTADEVYILIKNNVRLTDANIFVNTGIDVAAIVKLAQLNVDVMTYLTAIDVMGISFDELVWLREAQLDLVHYERAVRIKALIAEFLSSYKSKKLHLFAWLHSMTDNQILKNVSHATYGDTISVMREAIEDSIDFKYDHINFRNYDFKSEYTLKQETITKYAIPEDCQYTESNFPNKNPGDQFYGATLEEAYGEQYFETVVTVVSTDKPLLTDKTVAFLYNQLLSSSVVDKIASFLLGKDNFNMMKINKAVNGISAAKDLDLLHEQSHKAWTEMNNAFGFKSESITDVFDNLKAMNNDNLVMLKRMILNRAETVINYINEYRYFSSKLDKDPGNSEFGAARAVYKLGAGTLLASHFSLDITNLDVIENMPIKEEYKEQLKLSIKTSKLSSSIDNALEESVTEIMTNADYISVLSNVNHFIFDVGGTLKPIGNEVAENIEMSRKNLNELLKLGKKISIVSMGSFDSIHKDLIHYVNPELRSNVKVIWGGGGFLTTYDTTGNRIDVSMSADFQRQYYIDQKSFHAIATDLSLNGLKIFYFNGTAEKGYSSIGFGGFSNEVDRDNYMNMLNERFDLNIFEFIKDGTLGIAVRRKGAGKAVAVKYLIEQNIADKMIYFGDEFSQGQDKPISNLGIPYVAVDADNKGISPDAMNIKSATNVIATNAWIETVINNSSSSVKEFVDGGVKMEGLDVQGAMGSSSIVFKNVNFDSVNFKGFGFMISDLKILNNDIVLVSYA